MLVAAIVGKGLLSSVVGEPFEVAVMMMVTGKFPVSCLSSTEYRIPFQQLLPVLSILFCCIFLLSLSPFSAAKAFRWSQPHKKWFMMTKSIAEDCIQTKIGETGSENVVVCIAPNVPSIFTSPQLLACSTTHGKKALFRKLESNTGGGDGGIFSPPQG